MKQVLIILFSAFALLVVCNSIVRFTSNAFRQLYTNFLTADLSISKIGEDSTIFGNEALLIDDSLRTSILPDAEKIINVLSIDESVQNWAGVLTLPVQVKLNEHSENYIALGVDFESYFRLFPDIQLYSGSFPDISTGLPYIMLQSHQYEIMGSPPIGSKLLLTSPDDYNFTIREVVLSGVYAYPVEDSLISRSFLVDANIVRSLAGYISEPQTLQEVSKEQQNLLEADIEDLFSSVPQTPLSGSSETGDSLHIADIEKSLRVTSEPSVTRTVSESAWHFFLIDNAPEYSFRQMLKRLQRTGLSRSTGYRLLNWRSTVGGSAQLVFFLQIILNVALGTIIIGTMFIVMNSILLSLLERTKEIGTMRALGATKRTVADLITLEILLQVFTITLSGILFGLLLIYVVNNLNIRVDNRYMDILFGGNALRGIISVGLIIEHVIFSLFLAVVCVPYPLTKSLKIQPVRAMT